MPRHRLDLSGDVHRLDQRQHRDGRQRSAAGRWFRAWSSAAAASAARRSSPASRRRYGPRARRGRAREPSPSRSADRRRARSARRPCTPAAPARPAPRTASTSPSPSMSAGRSAQAPRSPPAGSTRSTPPTIRPGGLITFTATSWPPPNGKCADNGIGELVRGFRIGTAQAMSSARTAISTTTASTRTSQTFTQNAAFACNLVGGDWSSNASRPPTPVRSGPGPPARRASAALTPDMAR